MIEESKVIMGDLPPSWYSGRAKTITFCVTEDCNLACKYCYMTGKNKKNKMAFETATKAVDFILGNRSEFNDEAVIWEFIGGEPFLEIDLIDKISDYIKQQMYLLDHPWFKRYRFNFSSNGLLYSSPKVQNYIKKNKSHISIGISLDGNKIKHDLQRVRPDGTGSYEEVLKNAKLWMKQFPGNSTKATFAHDDLPYLKDSIISLWNEGIKMVAANVIFEDVWEDGDDLILEQQLKDLGDYVLENRLWSDHSVRFFDPTIGLPLQQEQLEKNYCGTGKMLAIDCEGNYFPCVRFYDMSLSNRKSFKIGDIYSGLDKNKIRPFEVLSTRMQSTQECIECDVASGCAWCSACNYDFADSDTVFQRMTYICKMHKATVRASKNFWNRFTKITSIPSRWAENARNVLNRKLIFITSDSIQPYCCYSTKTNNANVMSKKNFKAGIEYANKEGLTPVLLGKPSFLTDKEILEYSVIEEGKMEKAVKNKLFLEYQPLTDSTKATLVVNKENLSSLIEDIKNISSMYHKVNIIIQDIDKWDNNESKIYEKQLDDLVTLVYDSYDDKQPIIIEVFDKIMNNTSMKNCNAGEKSFAYAPNGEFYICPAFYYEGLENIGHIDSGIEIKNKHLLKLEYSPICMGCDAFHCSRCKYLNTKLTHEVNVPSKIQCTVSHLERNKAALLQQKLIKKDNKNFKNIIKEIDYMDPLEKIIKRREII